MTSRQAYLHLDSIGMIKRPKVKKRKNAKRLNSRSSKTRFRNS